MDKLIITATGIATIVGIYWFFFGKKDDVSTETTIVVRGGYNPSTIQIPNGKPTTLTFVRKDSNSCLEEIVLPDFKIKEFLPLNKPVTVQLSPTKPGAYAMHCGMNMFHGRIIVV